jgi:short-subunit dehydrogenase
MFQNKVVVITGSTQGIGLKTAELLGKRGAKLVINSRSPQKVDHAVSFLKQFSDEVIGIPGDVSDARFCDELKDATVQKFGKIDILINNAGVASSGLISELHSAAFEKIVSINFLGSVHPTLAFLPEIIQQKGDIIFISSIAGILGLPGYSAYSATKRAIVSFAESLKIELSGTGVFVGINYPGFTENDVQKTILNAKGEEEILKKRDGIKATSQEKTALEIIKQIEKRRFRAYSSISGKFIQMLVRFFPKLTITILSKLRKRMESMQ